MAQSAGLEIWTGAAVAERIGRLAAAPTALPVQSYPRKEFADFLLRHWPDFSASLQREHAIAPAALSRWRQMLRRAHDFETKDEKIFSRRGR